jgi:hypothetical protein
MPTESPSGSGTESLSGASVTKPAAVRLARGLFGPLLDPRSYGNLTFLLLTFPLGLAAFVFLACGLSIGLGLVILWVGFPVLLLTVAGSRGLALLERWLAMRLLGAPVPPAGPSGPRAVPAAAAGGGDGGGPERATASLGGAAAFWEGLKSLLSNPVTWKGMAYLALKLPLAIGTFIAVVVTGSVSLALLATPFLYQSTTVQLGSWYVDNLGDALIFMLLGAGLALLSLHVWNGIAWLWRQLAVSMLGSRRFAAATAGAS